MDNEQQHETCSPLPRPASLAEIRNAKAFDWHLEAAERLQRLRGQLAAMEERLVGNVPYSADNWETLALQGAHELCEIAHLHRAGHEMLACLGSA